MSNAGIKLSPKHGLNPTIPVCFWCGEERNEVALLGHIGDGRKHEDFEAPRHMVIDYEPCEKCRAKMALGVTLIEATSKPNSVAKVEMQKGIYPTGRYVVIKREAARKMFDNIGGIDKAFVDTELSIGWSSMVKQLGFPGFIELRWYGYGGIYLIVGRVWFTLKRGSMP